LAQHKSLSSPPIKTHPSVVPLSKPPDPVSEFMKPTPVVETWKTLGVTLINAAAYSYASKLGGSKCFQLWVSHPKVTSQSMTTSETMANMSNVPEEYHNFMDVFSKLKAGKSAEHQPYDLKITLDEGTSLPFGPIYSLSQEELTALCKFIDRNLATRFICPSFSSHGAPVLFIHKKDSSIWLCVDFRGLNQISKKD